MTRPGFIAFMAATLLLACSAPNQAQRPNTGGAAVRPIGASAFPAVRRIDWSRLPGPAALAGGAAERSRRILLNTNRYARLTWFPQRYGAPEARSLDLKGRDEDRIRPPSSEALALATSVATSAYDATYVGVPEEEARSVARRLIASVAAAHLATTPGGWGDEWQSALWAYYTGFAGWLLWGDLSADEAASVQRMVEHEADRFLDYQVPYYRDRDGNVVSPGDTKAEENAWNANLLQLATAMMPDHPRQPRWMRKNLELMVSAFARPADVHSARLINGRALREWLGGSNINDDGTLVNHDRIHPDYIATVLHNANAALAYSLSGMPTPEAAFFNADVMYAALVDRAFSSPPYLSPGGTIYIRGSADLYYPQGNDWGTHRRMHMVLVDVQAQLYGLDGRASKGGAFWEPLHASMVLAMQGRAPDRSTYQGAAEDTYAGREPWVAVHAAQAYLTHWIVQHGAFKVTDRGYP